MLIFARQGIRASALLYADFAGSLHLRHQHAEGRERDVIG